MALFEITDCDLKAGPRWYTTFCMGIHRSRRHYGRVDLQHLAGNVKLALVRCVARGFHACPVNGSKPRWVPSIASGDRVISFSPGGMKAWVLHGHRVEIQSERHETVLELSVAHGAGMNNLIDTALADDPHAYACTVAELSSYPFQIESVK